MVKITVQIEGMACGMCESHINDAIRRHFQVKKVTSSHKKAQTEIIAEEPLEEEAIKQAIIDTGYIVKSVNTESFEKRGLLAALRSKRSTE